MKRTRRPTPAPTRRRSLRERLAAPIGFTLAGGTIVWGWANRDAGLLTAEAGWGYFLGIVAATCMVTLLLYPLRKRLAFLSFIGSVSKWFRWHMILGVLGPLAALYHCNFQLGSLNSQIALFSALLVAGSGLIGRFLYRKIHQGLYGQKTDLKRLRSRVQLTPPAGGKVMTFLPELTRRMQAFDDWVLGSSTGIRASLTLLFRISVDTRLQYAELMRFVKQELATEARRSAIVAQHHKRLYASTRKHVAQHLFQVRRVAKLRAYDRLFALWHVAHLPFFVLLVVSVVIHVFAVHLY